MSELIPPEEATDRIAEIERERNPLKRAGKVLGPGLITGASDDDPSGIGTYAVAGATLGLTTLWTALLSFPLMAAVQNICARIGLVSGVGLARVIKDRYPGWILYPAVLALFLANTINVGADLGAVADAIGLLVGVHAVWLVIPVAIGILLFQIFGSYRFIASVFKYLTLALLAYVVDAVVVHPNVQETLRAAVIPTFSLDPTYVATLVAILGTTISPYLFFWQSSEEVEEEIAEGRTTEVARKGANAAELRYATIDVNIGMGASNIVMFFIILATALTLFKDGKTDIRSAADAAEALRPIAGDFAEILFAGGMIGAGLLAIPILSGSAAYAVSEAFGWRAGLEERWDRAKPFYGVIILATIVGMVLNFTGIDPIDALFYTAILNGIIAPPLLILVMLVARDPKVMGDRTIGPVLTTLGWLATAGMFLALAGLAYTTLFASR